MGQRPDRWSVQRARLCAIAIVTGIVLTLAGCGIPVSSQATQAGGRNKPAVISPTGAFPRHTITYDINQATRARGGGISAQVVYMRAFFQTDIPTLDQTVSDLTQAAALYAALRVLPPFPKDMYSCPNDSGNTYELTFFHGQTPTSWATVDPSGCETVELPNGDVRWAFGQNHFWAVLASALGVREADLFTGPRPTDPSAPQPTSSQP